MSNPKRTEKNRWLKWKWLFLLPLGVALLIWVKPSDLATVYLVIRQISPGQIAILLILQVISQLLVYAQWQSICRKMDCPVSFYQIASINLRGSLAEAITPGAKIGGELVRVWLLKQEAGCSKKQAAVIVLLQKILSISAFLFLSLFSIIYVSRHMIRLSIGVPYALVYAGPALLIPAVIWLLVPASRRLTIQLRNRIREPLARLFRYLSQMMPSRKWIGRHLLLSLLIWMIYPLKFIYIMSLYSADIHMIDLSAMTFVAYLAAMLPILPGGAAGFEAAMTGMLLVIGFPAVDGVAAAILFRFITFWFVLMIALVISIGPGLIPKAPGGQDPSSSVRLIPGRKLLQ